MRSSRIALITILSMASIVVAACGGAATTEAPALAAEQPTQAPAQQQNEPAAMPNSTIALPEVNPLEVTGDVVSAGSSTVFPLAERIQSGSRTRASRATSPSTASGAALDLSGSA